MIKAVIFDMDGVISDTLSLHAESESKVLLKYGIKMPPEEIIQKFNAVPDKQMFQKVFKMFNKVFEKNNKELDFHKIEDEKWQTFKELTKIGGIKIIPGSLKFIDLLLSNNFILGLASSSPQRIIDLILEALKIRKKFKVITCTEEVKKGKPAPDIFLLTAKKLGATPQNCVVFEDAPRGVQAAKAAGMKCIAITTTHKKVELEKADRIVEQFDNIRIEEILSL